MQYECSMRHDDNTLTHTCLIICQCSGFEKRLNHLKILSKILIVGKNMLHSVMIHDLKFADLNKFKSQMHILEQSTNLHKYE